MRLQHFALYPPKSFIHKLPIKNDIHKHNNINHTLIKNHTVRLMLEYLQIL